MPPITRYVEVVYEFGTDYPTPEPGVMAVVCEGGVPVMVDFLCPCGCGRTCPTHLVPPGEPHKGRRWAFRREPNGVTLVPSIRYLSGCKWHFNITNGAVIVHGDSGK